ncbi:hypothetical protein AU255_01055 [Methyloprofundus sedimenti]|uniref:Uncharacterized protein n=1 Tax=Methyloprofundus sedimenti TaxID=1420851 RepID=A0A1V8M4Q4_9GAMM|nr:hypothetical protein AU255_01055 [Methyloprofundus sedimenti]
MSLAGSLWALLAILILSRFWFALVSLKDIANIAQALIDDAARSWHAAKSGKKDALNFFAQAKKLFEIRTILN